jgi:hypothetical protein
MATPKKGLERIVSKARSVGKQAVTGLQKNTRKNTKKIRRNVAAFQEDVVVLLGAPIDKIRELDNKWRIIADFKMAFKGGGNCGLQLVERKMVVGQFGSTSYLRNGNQRRLKSVCVAFRLCGTRTSANSSTHISQISTTACTWNYVTWAT